jgi:hypothetical protein
LRKATRLEGAPSLSKCLTSFWISEPRINLLSPDKLLGQTQFLDLLL